MQKLHLSCKLLGYAGLTLSHDNSMLASISRDKTVKVRHDVCVPGVCFHQRQSHLLCKLTCDSLAHQRRVALQVFDVITFDMIAMLRLPFVPSCAAFTFKVDFLTLHNLPPPSIPQQFHSPPIKMTFLPLCCQTCLHLCCSLLSLILEHIPSSILVLCCKMSWLFADLRCGLFHTSLPCS